MTEQQPSRGRTQTQTESQIAVDSYLDTLLREATEAPPKKPQRKRVVQSKASAVPVEPQVVPIAEPPALAVIDDSVEPPQLAVDVLDCVPAGATDPTELPAWAAERFQCLYFDLGEWRFAVPLVGLQRIIKPGETLRRLPGAMPWVLGVCEHPEGRARLIDLAQAMDVSQNIDEAPADDNPQARWLLLAGGNWACRCDVVGEVSWVEPEQVQWSGQQRKPRRRPWEAGVLRSALRILIDPARLNAWLDEGVGRSA
jgi:purine-binding chemotaxis protein CheW